MVQDTRRLSVFIIDREVIDGYGPKLGPNGIAIYAVLSRMANAEGSCFPTVETIGNKVGLSVNPTRNALKTLEDTGLITVTRRRGQEGDLSNVYTLTDVVKTNDPTPPAPVQSGNLYERTVGRVGASNNKIMALTAIWREVFGHEVTPGSVGALVKLAGGDAEAVAKAMLKVVWFFGTVDAPFNAVKRELDYQANGRRAKPTARTPLVVRDVTPTVEVTKEDTNLDDIFGGQ